MEMEHYITCYLQEKNEPIQYKVLSKCKVPQFIEEHQHVSCIVVCDPRSRTNTTYHYGKVQKQAG